MILFFFFQAEDGIRDLIVTGVQTCALPISKKPVQTKIWHHIVIALNGADIKLFINGKEDGSIEGDTKVSGPFLTIGMPHNHRRGFFGSIDDVRIYNRALSAEEVKALYDLEKPKSK
mgnify:CR=1 FL=1